MALGAALRISSSVLFILSLSVLLVASEPAEVSWSLGGGSGGTFINTTSTTNPGALRLEKGLHLLGEARYDSGGTDVAAALAIDSQDNVILTGRCRQGRDYHCTVKYNPNGRIIWTRRYGTGTTERGTGAAVDSKDNIVVVGYSVSGGYIHHLVKYDPQEKELWSRIYNGGEYGRASAVAVDLQDNIVVTGVSNSDLYTMKYSPQGRLLWSNRLDNGGTDEATAVAVDAQGNIVIAGKSNRVQWNVDNNDYYLVKLSSDGEVLWDWDYDEPRSDAAQGVAIDSQNRIVITGYSEQNGNYDYYTVKLTPTGRKLWARRLDKTQKDLASSVAIDHSDSIIITGTTIREGNKDYLTVKYNPQGELLWEVNYDSSPDDAAYGLATDSKESVIVAGTSLGDYHWLKYSDGFLPQGGYISPIHYFGEWVRFRTLEADATLHRGELLAKVETSDDRFATVKRARCLPLRSGRVSYDIRALGRARYARVRLYFRTEDPRFSPALYSLVIEATAD